MPRGKSMLSNEESREGIMICDLCHNSELSDENVEILDLQMWSQHCSFSSKGKKRICVGCLNKAGVNVDKLLELIKTKSSTSIHP